MNIFTFVTTRRVELSKERPVDNFDVAIDAGDLVAVQRLGSVNRIYLRSGQSFDVQDSFADIVDMWMDARL